MRWIHWIALPGLLLTAASATAQQPQPPPGADDFAEHLFPPELIMQNQQRIGLRAEQRSAITETIRELQNLVVDLQWRMQGESQRLREILAGAHPDEAAALEQIDRILSAEREVKKAHLRMLIRIKNVLTPEQQEMLRRHRDSQPRTPRPPSDVQPEER